MTTAEHAMNGLGSRLSLIANELGGLEKAAREASVSLAQFKRYIKGDNQPTFGSMVALAKSSNVSLEWLATGEGQMRPDDAASDDTGQQASAAGGLSGQIDFIPVLENIIANAVSGLEHWRRRDHIPISPDLEGELVAHICSILVDRFNLCVAENIPLPDYLAGRVPFDFIAELEADPRTTAMAAMFRALALRR